MYGSAKLAAIKRLEKSWERFIVSGEFDAQAVDSTIAASWQRCKTAAVNPVGGTCFRIHSDGHLEQLLEANKMLLDIARPVIESIYYTVQGSGFMVVLVNHEGIVLQTMGDCKTLLDAESLHFFRGADWTEESVGTNAIGTCLATGIPIQVTAAEHFCTEHHDWTCSAAPIRGPGGDLLGCLDMSGPYDKMHPHTLGMIVAAAKAIESQLRREITNNELTSTLSRLVTAVNTVSEGILHINADGVITDANISACKMLGLAPDKLKGQKAGDTLGNMRELKRLLAAGEGENDRRQLLDTPRGRFYCSTRSITGGSKKQGEAVMVISPASLGKESVDSGECKPKNAAGRSTVTLSEKPAAKSVTGGDFNRARFTFTDIIGASSQMQAAKELARRAAACSSTVLLLGESGSGKEIFAQAIHNASDRRHGPFIPVNCAAMPAGLIQSELFGYSEGAFTGARRGGQPGKFELAGGGTLFLDEIGDMPLEMQSNLLRVLQEKTVTRVGGKKVIPVDVRVIAATNKDLHQEMQNGKFREDLFYRINVLSIKIPPLRERETDLEYLIEHCLAGVAARLGKNVPRIDPAAMEVLARHHWPGNVRELVNVLEQAVIITDNDLIMTCHLPCYLTGKRPVLVAKMQQVTTLEQLEQQAIKAALDRFNGNISRTARALGIGRNTLYDKLKKYNIR
ncbi:sigma-54-dependent Fis family transcriptional regulator [Desulfoscipio geothermicus]|uniref:PAS domain S-box-containing protein n=1 Tax=Desulfoscipio geothermicus DSM 3669 TaxID=1121426 RepID=A0A1I6D4H7_9FIRM|nr:sigma-54-dependent Fis family transcriptional regulator [Desulfoscipio geothermicus]SFR00345.1 PAS domain S-box-containing protein [Desulfoscipio geothermicus DSM 3669]